MIEYKEREWDLILTRRRWTNNLLVYDTLYFKKGKLVKGDTEVLGKISNKKILRRNISDLEL